LVFSLEMVQKEWALTARLPLNPFKQIFLHWYTMICMRVKLQYVVALGSDIMIYACLLLNIKKASTQYPGGFDLTTHSSSLVLFKINDDYYN
jgi:hypothetical protein